MSPRPGEGERRAAGGYRPQYLVSAATILDALEKGDLEWIRVADPDAGRVDDLQIATTARVDAYQVKWAQYSGTITLRHLVSSTDKTPSPIAQLADGWRRLRKLHPHSRIVVHLAANGHPSSSASAWMPETTPHPTPYHLAAFIEQAWHPAHINGKPDLDGEWAAVWESICTASGLLAEEFLSFVLDCSLDFQAVLPEEDTDVLTLADLLFATAAGAERIVELSRDELLRRLGWTSRYVCRNIHEFPSPKFLYRPIRSTVEAIEAALNELQGGYVGMLGSPGSGKSTLLTRTLRALPIRLVRYYAYVPESQDPSVLRGESINFLHDVTLRLQQAGIGQGKLPDPSDRAARLDLFHRQLDALGHDYVATGTKTVILVDGLDHIAREQHPERSLLKDLPLPEAIPDGVYIVLGSQTDELADLPPRVHHTLRQQGRRIKMDRLKPLDVSAIADKAVPGLGTRERQQVFELSGGHPLALIYLLKQLQRAGHPEERASLLEEAIPYQGDIEAQYWGHWRAIVDDDALVYVLGLLARIRGPIPMRWIAEWSETSILKRLRSLLPQYFEEEGQDRWVFFHNSFRLFLVDQTTEPLPGQSSEHRDRAYHRELADRYEASQPPWQWEALYHRYSARDFAAVVAMATPHWFREQVEALRPLDAVQTDARLALQAAGVCRDVVALAELTLVGAALEQRAWTLEDRLLPDLLIEAGEAVQAAEHLRDGNRLRVGEEQALRLSPRLIEVGLEREGRRIFELAEPLEILSGRPIPKDHTRPQNLWALLREWVRCATIFRGAEEAIQVIRRIRIEPGWNSRESVEQSSKRLQGQLLFHGALASCRQGHWMDWQSFFDALDERQDQEDRFFALLRAAQYTHEVGDTDRLHALLHELLTMSESSPLVAGKGRWIIEERLEMAELALRVAGDKAIAQTWIGRVSPIPLQDTSLDYEKKPSFHELRFQRARLLYLLGETREPEALRDEAETNTRFGEYVENDEKAGWRQIALAVLYLARLWAWGYLGRRLAPVSFLQEVRWILDLLGPGWRRSSPSLRLRLLGARPEVLRYAIIVAGEHGDEVVKALGQELETRWTDPDEGSAWTLDLQRELTVEMIEVGSDQAWAETQLRRIESAMLQDLDPYSRVEACEKQSKAWLTLGDSDQALIELRRMVHAARGILSDNDYQLPKWVNWLGRVNELEPEQAKGRIRLMLRRILSVQGSASGVVDAAEEFLGVIFRWSPRRATRLLKILLECRVLGHQGGVTHLLEEALDAQEPPIQEILHAVVDLVLPFVPGTEPELLETLVVRVAGHLGVDAALDIARYLVNRIEVDVPANSRSSWCHGVNSGLRTIGAAPSQVGLDLSEFEDQSEHSSQPDRDFYLRNGERLKPDDVLARVQTVDDLEGLLAIEDREHSQYSDWVTVVENLVSQLSSVTELERLENTIASRLVGTWSSEDQLGRSLTTLSKRSLELGDRARAWALAERALDATRPPGWDPYYDGGTRHTAIQHLIVVDPDRGRDMAIELYARDLGERFRAPARVALHLYDILQLLSREIPVAEVWHSIETHLDDLFTSVLVEPEPSLEAVLEEPIGKPEEDTADRAIADLLALYLDHLSYSVAQGAVRACTATVLGGSKAVAIALKEALASTDQAAERALMVLDSASMEDPASVLPFHRELDRLHQSPNFAIRLIATEILARTRNEPSTPPVVERAAPPIYALHLPELALHHTERSLEEDSAPVMMGDPALTLRPLDIELRTVAEAADLPEDNVLRRAVQHYRKLEVQRTWLAGCRGIEPRRLSAFLDEVGLRHSYYRPHIAPARHALAHVVAELYDARYFPPAALPWLSRMLVHYDPAFILRHPDRRPSCIEPIGSIAVDNHTFVRLPDDWVETGEDSLPLLHTQTYDGRTIIGEWTQLKLLEDDWPEEERMAVVRVVGQAELWNGSEVERGHPPFARLRDAQVVNYLDLRASLDHLVIAHDGLDLETPGAHWLAFNPAVGQALGWQPLPGGWFRWADRQGFPVVESIWWKDGPLHQFSTHLHVEVGSGWLVLIAEKGFKEVVRWARRMSRGGAIRRSKGWHGDAGRGHAVGVLKLP